MARLRRSIAGKIFGMAVFLLVMLAMTAIWSAQSSQALHRQLQTISQSLLPLVEVLADFREVSHRQGTTAQFLLITPNPESADLCMAKTREEGLAGAYLGKEAERYLQIGSEIATLDLNRMKLARWEPMLAELRLQQEQLSNMTLEACRLEASSEEMTAARSQARNVQRLADSISSEIAKHVEETALLVTRNQEQALKANIAMITAATLVGLMLAFIVARGLTRPIIRLQAGAKAVSQGALDTAAVTVTTNDEIGDVSVAFNGMVEGLRDKERIKKTFGLYVDPRIVNEVLAAGSETIAGERQTATVYLADLVGFTALGERLAPASLVSLINAFFTEMSVPIRERGGVIDKYIGDAIMAFWAPPFSDPAGQAQAACAVLLEQRARLEAFRKQVPDILGLRRDVPAIDFRAALTTGEVLMGSVGSASARSFTVMGDTVNLCSRLESANKIYGTNLLIDGATRDLAGDDVEVREVDRVAVVGRTEAVRIYELLSMRGELSSVQQRLRAHYQEGLAAYRSGHWPEAEKHFTAALAGAPEDGPSQTMLGRVRVFANAPPEDWTGDWHLFKK